MHLATLHRTSADTEDMIVHLSAMFDGESPSASMNEDDRADNANSIYFNLHHFVPRFGRLYEIGSNGSFLFFCFPSDVVLYDAFA